MGCVLGSDCPFVECLIVQGDAPSFEIFSLEHCNPQLVKLPVQMGEHQLPHFKAGLRDLILGLARGGRQVGRRSFASSGQKGVGYQESGIQNLTLNARQTMANQ